MKDMKKVLDQIQDLANRSQNLQIVLSSIGPDDWLVEVTTERGSTLLASGEAKSLDGACVITLDSLQDQYYIM